MPLIRRTAPLAGLSAIALLMAGCATVPVASSQPPATQAAALPQPTGTTGWNFPVYDIPADPAVRYGVLDNGMRYAIMRNTTPQGTAAIRMGFDVGFMDEADGEYGLAHFIEHMAFNGSTNVPEGEMIKLLEREGLAFGADTNASTSFEETIYKLDLPRADDRLLGIGLMLMRETASELLLDPAAIDRERGILLSETRTRNTPQLRQFSNYFDFVSPGTRYAERFPGPRASDTVTGASAETLRTMYRRFYRPDNATLVVVGDFDPATVEGQIRQRFADWRAAGGPLTQTDAGKIAFDRPRAATIHVDPAVNWQVTIDRFAPYQRRPVTMDEMRRSLLLSLGTGALNRRFSRIANQPDAPILGGSTGVSDFFELARQTSIGVVAKDGDWQKALQVGEQETRRALEHGFTDAEIAEQLANMETAFRTAAEQAATRRNPALAEAILSTVAQQRIFATPAARYAAFQSLKPELTRAAAEAVFRDEIGGSEPLIHLAAKTAIEGGEAAVLATYDASRAAAVTPPAQVADAPFGYSNFGPAGTVASDSQIADLGLRTVRFANNVMLTMKRTDFEAGRVRFAVRIGEGELALPQDRPGLALLMNSTYATAGLGKHSVDELRRLLAGKQVTTGLAANSDHFGVGGATTMADFPLQMQVSAAYLTDPGYRAEAEAQWRASIPLFHDRLDATPQGVAGRDAGRIVANGDPRFGIPAKDELLALDLAALRGALTPALANAPIEIAVVGDIDEAAVIAAVANSFGALPQRAAVADPREASRQARFAAQPRPTTLYHSGAPDQALAQIFWPTTDDRDQQQEVTLAMLAGVMDLLLTEKIREELGATYSPSSGSSMSDVYRDFGTFSASIVVKPEQADEVFAAVEEIVAGLKAAPVSADTLARARTPVLEQISRNRRENGYWLGVADEAQLRPDRLARVRAYEGLVRAVTPAELQAAARRYLDPSRKLELRVVHTSLRPGAAAAN